MSEQRPTFESRPHHDANDRRIVELMNQRERAYGDTRQPLTGLEWAKYLTGRINGMMEAQPKK
jgi:hypothetical protein